MSIVLPPSETFCSDPTKVTVSFVFGQKVCEEGRIVDAINDELAIQFDFVAPKPIFKSRSCGVRILVQDILTVTFSSSSCTSSSTSSQCGRSSLTTLVSKGVEKVTQTKVESSNSDKLSKELCLHYVDRSLSSNRWRLRSLCLSHEDPLVIDVWLKVFDDLLRVLREDRPKRLLVFVNPFGGFKRAGRVFSAAVEPVLKLMSSEVNYDVIITERKNHASDIVTVKDLTKFDGIVAVGGDGLFNEIVDAILKRQLRSRENENCTEKSDSHTHDEGKSWIETPSLRMGVIPAGSTNSMALTLHGTTDVTTAVLHILVGDRRRIDVSSVYLDGVLKRFSVALMSHGYFGEIIERSEQFRWLGPKRYELSGLRTWMGNRGYAGSVLLKHDLSTYSKSNNVPLKRAETSLECSAECDVCTEAQPSISSSAMRPSYSVPSSLSAVYTKSRLIRGRFLGVTCCTNAAHSQLTRKGLAPGGHLGDGLLELILVHKTSRLNYSRYLYRTAFHLRSPYALPFVERFRVREFTYHPDQVDEDSVWNLDGELLHVGPTSKIKVRANCQLLSVFGRGPEFVN